ncbi:MAG: 30S ribosomal protein S8 [bacterium]|nr:30S ribosomal protein S8 [bacterium]
MLNDPLANALSVIMNAEKIGKEECMIKPISKTIKKVLAIMNENTYVGTAKEIEDGRGNVLTVSLLGKVNKCGAVKPRYSIKKDNFERFEKRFLPAKDFGILIVSTSKGLMTNDEAKKKGIGGVLIAYCY